MGYTHLVAMLAHDVAFWNFGAGASMYIVDRSQRCWPPVPPNPPLFS